MIIDDKIDTIIKLDTQISDLEGKIERIENFIDKNSTLRVVPAFAPVLEESSENGIFLLRAPTWRSTDIIATDTTTGQEFTAAELSGQKLLLPYTGNNEEEVYFYGQFNENNHWDGDCILNVYKNNNLILITEAEYNDGALLTYKQALSNNKNSEWIISERKNEGDLNSGDSWKYTSGQVFTKSFNFDTVNAIDICSVNNFNSNLSAKLKEYYHGNTSKGYYNDNTGNAYFISYMDDGTVKTLYVGNFNNGLFDDSTGNAWYITRTAETNYMYFKGIFKKGEPQHDSENIFENDLTFTRIQEIINGKKFNCELKWVDDKSSQTT